MAPRVSSLFDREEFLATLRARFLASQAVRHDRRVHGTLLFDGVEASLRRLVHRDIEEFAR